MNNEILLAAIVLFVMAITPYGNPSRKMGIFLRCFIFLIFSMS